VISDFVCAKLGFWGMNFEEGVGEFIKKFGGLKVFFFNYSVLFF